MRASCGGTPGAAGIEQIDHVGRCVHAAPPTTAVENAPDPAAGTAGCGRGGGTRRSP